MPSVEIIAWLLASVGWMPGDKIDNMYNSKVSFDRAVKRVEKRSEMLNGFNGSGVSSDLRC